MRALATFRPPLWAVLLYLGVLFAMLALGRWQLLRADEKIDLIARADAARAAEAIAIETLEDEAAMARAAADYRRVSVRGRWRPATQFLWDNRARQGRAGVEVLAPLELDDGRLVLVNRGWQPLSTRRERLPPVDLEPDLVTVDGFFSRPSRGFSGGEAFVASAPWPRYLQYFDYPAIAAALDAELVPGLLQPSAAFDDAPWRYAPNWQPAASGPEKHYSYAVQWFAMALALTVIFVIVNRGRGVPQPPRTDPES